jgi:hypothetical protein
VDIKQQANKIITDYYNTGRLKVRIDGYYKGKLHISRYTKIAEEVELQVWLELSKYPPEKLVERFNRNPNSIEALAVVIAKYQFMHKKSNPNSPNNSFGTKLVFGSNYFSDDYVSPTDTYNDSGDNTDYRGIPISDGEFFADRDYSPDRWQEIQKRLTPDEIEFVTALWNGEKFYKRKPTNAYKEYRDYILQKIKNMDLNKGLAPLEQIKTKLTMQENKLFDVMFDDDLSRQDKITKLKFSEPQYIAQRRILLKKIKGFNVK